MDRAAKIEYSRPRQIPAHPSKTTRAEGVGRGSCPESAIRGEPWRTNGLTGPSGPVPPRPEMFRNVPKNSPGWLPRALR